VKVAKAGSAPTITRQELNRATLARQLLLEREKISALGAIQRLVAMQAQLTRPPYVGLWTRVKGFKREDLTALFTSREAVRGTHLRGTLHVMSAKDFARFRGTIQPALSAGMQAILRDRLKGFDVDSVIAAARELFAKGPTGFEPVREYLIRKFPKGDERAMGYAARLQVPLLQCLTRAAGVMHQQPTSRSPKIG
jgi:hypothetical protein